MTENSRAYYGVADAYESLAQIIELPKQPARVFKAALVDDLGNSAFKFTGVVADFINTVGKVIDAYPGNEVLVSLSGKSAGQFIVTLRPDPEAIKVETDKPSLSKDEIRIFVSPDQSGVDVKTNAVKPGQEEFGGGPIGELIYLQIRALSEDKKILTIAANAILDNVLVGLSDTNFDD